MRNRFQPGRDFLICLTKKLNELSDDVFVPPIEERGRDTRIAGTARTPNAVHVVINVRR
jgi:hypothetical protein